MAITCPECGNWNRGCTCPDKKDVNKPMAPVEIQGSVDKHWRQFRNTANQDVFLRMAIQDLNEQLEERAEERRTAALDMVEAMQLGGLHPRTQACMN